MAQSFQRWTGILAIIAGILALLSLVVGLSGVNFEFEAFSDPSFLIGIGSEAAILIRWSYWLNMLGNYLLMIPLALLLYQWLKPISPSFAQLFTLGGLLYLILGAVGSAIFASAWPHLIGAYETAVEAERTILLSEFMLVNAIAGEGFHGVLQDLAATVWFLGMGVIMRQKRSGLGYFTIALGIFLLLNTIGNIFNIEALSLLGLTANIVLGPIWAILLGILFVRQKVL